MDSDSLGNFYVAWLDGSWTGTLLDTRVVVTRIRYDGTVEKEFVTITCDTTPGFDNCPGVNVVPSGEYFVLTFTRNYDTALPAMGVGASLPAYHYSWIQYWDSSGIPLTPEIQADSLTAGSRIESGVLTSLGAGSIWRARDSVSETLRLYKQFFDLGGHRIGPISQVDESNTLTFWHGQRGRADSWAGGFVVTWDEVVAEIGPQDQRPVYRVFDDLSNPVTPSSMGAVQPGYVPDCGAKDTGYQSGYFPDVAVNDSGTFMLAWSSCDGQTLYPWGAKTWGQTYYADGTPRSPLILLADAYPGDSDNQRVAWGADGYFYVVWADTRYATPNPQTWHANMWVQRVTPDGVKVGPNYIVNDLFNALHSSFDCDVAVSRDRACFVWRDYRNSPAPILDGEIFGKVISLDLIGTYMKADVNRDYSITSADIIYLVNYVFKGGPRPLAGSNHGDVTGDCVTNAADIIYYVNFVFKGGLAFNDPCSE